MTTNHSRGRERHDWGTLPAGLIALTALAAAVLLAISLAPASAETPAERCKRETTAYNNAWKNSWAASHPGKKPSDAPKPPVPYKCGSNNDGPPPTLSPSTPENKSPEDDSASTQTPEVPSTDGGGPNMNAPTERRELEHPQRGQAPIGKPYSSSTPDPRRPVGARQSGPTKDASKPSIERPQSRPRSLLPGVKPRLVEGGTPTSYQFLTTMS